MYSSSSNGSISALALLITLGIWMAVGFAGYSIGQRKGRGGLGLLLGLVLGLLGLLIIALMGPKQSYGYDNRYTSGYTPPPLPPPPLLTPEQHTYQHQQMLAAQAAWHQQVYGTPPPQTAPPQIPPTPPGFPPQGS